MNNKTITKSRTNTFMNYFSINQEANKSAFSFVKFVLIMSLITSLISDSLSLIITQFLDAKAFCNPSLAQFSEGTIFFMAIVFAPLVETLLFQFLIIRLIILFNFKHHYSTAIVVSAIAFASTHYYSYYYILIAFLIGLLLAYVLLKAHKEYNLGFLATALVHAFSNLSSIVVDSLV